MFDFFSGKIVKTTYLKREKCHDFFRNSQSARNVKVSIHQFFSLSFQILRLNMHESNFFTFFTDFCMFLKLNFEFEISVAR